MLFYRILSAISVYKISQFCSYVGRNIPDNCLRSHRIGGNPER